MAQLFSDSQGTALAVGDRVSTPDGSGTVLALVMGNVPGVDSDEAAVVDLGMLQRAYPPSALAQAEPISIPVPVAARELAPGP